MITSASAKRVATVLTPRNPMVFDRVRLQRVEAAAKLSPVEQWLVENARQNPEESRITILRAVNSSGTRVWLFDPSFENAELEEVGYLLTKALLPFHRALAQTGVVLMAHSDWGDRESYGLRSGVWRRVDELSVKTTPTADESLDLWALKNMVHHMSLSLEHVVRNVLPRHRAMVDRSWARLQKTLGARDPAAR
jgi:hypothetical protein